MCVDPTEMLRCFDSRAILTVSRPKPALDAIAFCKVEHERGSGAASRQRVSDVVDELVRGSEQIRLADGSNGRARALAVETLCRFHDAARRKCHAERSAVARG